MRPRPASVPLLLAAVLAALAVAAPAKATTLVLADGTVGPQPYQSWVDRAQVPTPPGKVSLHLEPCPGASSDAAGCAMLDDGAIYLGPDGRAKATFFHELGHIFDAAVMTDLPRLRFAAVMHLSGPWVAAPYTNPPGEQFAEGYALCARHRTIRGIWGGGYLYTPDAQQHRRVCALIRQAAVTQRSV
jgi:hypothetical protein